MVESTFLDLVFFVGVVKKKDNFSSIAVKYDHCELSVIWIRKLTFLSI